MDIFNHLADDPIPNRTEQALAALGGEPLAGSGFEDEVPEPEFTDLTTRRSQ